MTMMEWSRTEHALFIITDRLLPGKNILEKFHNSKEGDACKVIGDLKNCADEKYEQFIFEKNNYLEQIEKWKKQEPGEYRKNFVAFIDGLHDARHSRNFLVHDISKIWYEIQFKIYSKDEVSYNNFKEKFDANENEHDESMLDFIAEHHKIISRVSIPTVIFSLWVYGEEPCMSPPNL